MVIQCALRLIYIETFPQFSAEEENISVFYDGDAFIKLFDETEWGQTVSGEEQSMMKKVIEQYFYRIGGNSAGRIWGYLSGSSELPPNNIGV